MTEELKELQRAINGKEVIFMHSRVKSVKMNALIIWPPNGDTISIKPYGYDSTEIQKRLEEAVYCDLDEIESPEFCLASHLPIAALEDGEDMMPVLKRIAQIPNGGLYCISKVNHYEKSFSATPTCPYG